MCPARSAYTSFPEWQADKRVALWDAPQNIRVLGQINSLHSQLSQSLSSVNRLFGLAGHSTRALVGSCTILVVWTVSSSMSAHAEWR